MHIFLENQCGYNPEIPEIIYHYCSTDTMLKIIENHSIWLSDLEKTNDKKELKYLGEKVKGIYEKIGYDVILTSVKEKKGIEELRENINGKEWN